MISTFVLHRDFNQRIELAINVIVQDLASDLQTKPATFGECMKGVDGSILAVATVDDDTAASHRFVGFWNTHLTDSDGSRDGHNGGRDEVLGRNPESDICSKYSSGNRGEACIIPHQYRRIMVEHTQY